MITYLKEDSNEQVNPILYLKEKSRAIKEKVRKKKPSNIQEKFIKETES